MGEICWVSKAMGRLHFICKADELAVAKSTQLALWNLDIQFYLWLQCINFVAHLVFKYTTSNVMYLTMLYMYRIVGNFRVVQIFAFFEGRAVNAKIKIGRNSTHQYFTCKACGVCGFLVLKREYFNHKHFFWGLSSHSAKIFTLENFPLYHRYYPDRKTFAMWKIARIGREKHQKAWKQEIRREQNSNPLQRNSHVHFREMF